jgi:hypothetical protein
MAIDDLAPFDNSKFYGGGGTIHQTPRFNVSLHKGRVVSVWFRCLAVPFDQNEVDEARAIDMDRMYAEMAKKPMRITGVEYEREDV